MNKKNIRFFIIVTIYILLGWYYTFCYNVLFENERYYYLIISMMVIISFSIILFLPKFRKKISNFIGLENGIIKITEEFSTDYRDIFISLIMFSIFIFPGYVLKINSLSIKKKIDLQLPIYKVNLPKSRSKGSIILKDNNNFEYIISISPDDIKKARLGEIYKIRIYEGWLGIKFYKMNFWGYKRVEP